ncbi:hypothetical protein OAA60_02990 [Porticoccaceae bacterium]|nr:hypothetical protein [Porticoccaceae bacterium]
MADWSEKLKQNSGMNFVQRAINPNIFPRINNADGSVSTHLMAAEVDENGDWYAFPTIIQDGSGELIKMSTPEAFDYAKRSGESIPFGKDGNGAIDFSINYKSPSMIGKPQPKPQPKTDGTVVNVKGLGLMRVAQQSQPQATAGINARADKQRATQDAIGNFFGALPPAEDMRGMIENPELLKQALDDKFQEVRNFTDMATEGLTPTQKAAFLTMGVNGLGDLAGLAADMEMYITDPESRTWFNAAMTGTGVAGGALSVSPAMAGILPIVQKNIDTWRDTTLYHGTAADIKKFDPLMGGSVTKARSAKQGTWLVDDPEVAGGYARLAAEDAPVQKLIDESQAAERAGEWDKAHDLMAEAEKLEQGGELIGGGGQNIMPLKVRGNLMEFDAEGASMSDLDDAQLFKWSQEAKKGGYDGLQIKNFSDNADYGSHKAANHYLIFDPENIRSTFDPPAVGEMMGGDVPVKSTLDELIENAKGRGVDLSVSDRGDSLSVNKIVVPKEKRGQGLGSSTMEDVVRYADSGQKKVTLSPSTDFGGTSSKRLSDFYKRFGFVENKGRNKDFTISEGMFRNPINIK